MTPAVPWDNSPSDITFSCPFNTWALNILNIIIFLWESPDQYCSALKLKLGSWTLLALHHQILTAFPRTITQNPSPSTQRIKPWTTVSSQALPSCVRHNPSLACNAAFPIKQTILLILSAFLPHALPRLPRGLSRGSLFSTFIINTNTQCSPHLLQCSIRRRAMHCALAHPHMMCSPDMLQAHHYSPEVTHPPSDLLVFD